MTTKLPHLLLIPGLLCNAYQRRRLVATGPPALDAGHRWYRGRWIGEVPRRCISALCGVVEHAGHFTPLEEPDEVGAFLREWIRVPLKAVAG